MASQEAHGVAGEHGAGDGACDVWAPTGADDLGHSGVQRGPCPPAPSPSSLTCSTTGQHARSVDAWPQLPARGGRLRPPTFSQGQTTPGPCSPPPQPQAPGLAVQRGSAPVPQRWGSGCASAAWPGAGGTQMGGGMALGIRRARTRAPPNVGTEEQDVGADRRGDGVGDKGWQGPGTPRCRHRGWERVSVLTSRLIASLIFWKQSTNSASEGGRARSVRTPSGMWGRAYEPGWPSHCPQQPPGSHLLRLDLLQPRSHPSP